MQVLYHVASNVLTYRCAKVLGNTSICQYSEAFRGNLRLYFEQGTLGRSIVTLENLSIMECKLAPIFAYRHS